MTASVLLPTGQALAEVERLLDTIDPDRSSVDAATRLEWVRVARRVRGRLDALTGLLIGEADRAGASQRVVGTPLASWLGMGETLSRREATRDVHQARAMVEHPVVAQAATLGQVGGGQLRAITSLLDRLAPQLDTQQLAHAEQVLIGLASHLDADQLAKSASRVLAEVAPADTDRLLETQLQRDVEAARLARSLRFYREGASLRFSGSLPRIEGEQWVALLDAHSQAIRRTIIETRDPLAETVSTEQRYADALIAMIEASTHAKPESGVGATRVIVTLDYHRLHQDAAGAGLISEGDQLSAGELRRLCCDAHLIPTVLGGPSEVLDVGRANRLVTKGIRTALIQRDKGCAFPGCGIRPNLCDAHHITPWWKGGTTSLTNLVLLCHTHHGLVEPAKYGTRDQWEVRIALDGAPEFLPPARMNPLRQPIRNQHHAPPRAA